MEEIWKPIDDRYFVSNLGRVKSTYANKERILKPFYDKRGYLHVDLRHPGQRKGMSVHRLVALAFIPNPNNLPEVNHKDQDKTNNCVENLEWITLQDNCNYGTRNERHAEHNKRPVYSIDDYGNIKHYKSRIEAAKEFCIDPTNISKAISPRFPRNIRAVGRYWYKDVDNYFSANND